jgi:monoamine oxidase
MLEVAIVGGGLSGLALAYSLRGQGGSFALFEARPRLGGRILSTACAIHGMRVDLGPTWFWPETQPQIARLLDDLGLAAFAQHDSDEVLSLGDPDKAAERVAIDTVHGGAQRLEGGMATLVEALAQGLPEGALHLEHELCAVIDRGEHVELQFRHGQTATTVRARRVVLAVPPRLLDEHVRFAPPLSAETRQAMRATPTWMADRAKVVVAYEQAFWRQAGHSGNAFVGHEQAVLGEIFDACDASGDQAALGGFVALSPALRESFRDGLSLLMGNQMLQLFGSKLEHGEQHFQDWANEPYTCSALDRTPAAGHPEYGNPLLRRAQWSGRLRLAGAETAAYAGGYMEGALESAARIARELGHVQAPLKAPGRNAVANRSSMARFGEWVGSQRSRALQRYRLQLNQDLSAQRREQLTQRALLGTVEQIYSEALSELDTLPFDASGVAIERGRSALTPEVLDPFDGFINALIDEAVRFNAASCAISNFPGEHKPDQDYLKTIRRDLAAAWREFAYSANRVLVAKHGREGAHNG